MMGEYIILLLVSIGFYVLKKSQSAVQLLIIHVIVPGLLYSVIGMDQPANLSCSMDECEGAANTKSKQRVTCYNLLLFPTPYLPQNYCRTKNVGNLDM